MALPHPVLGPFGHVRTPIDFSDSRVAPFRAPAIGEHNAEIVQGLAGISAERYNVLVEEGVLK